MKRLLLFMILALNLFSIPVFANENTDTPNNNVVSRFKIYTEPEKLNYLSGEEILFYAGISLTENSGIVNDSVLEIKVPMENIVNGTFDASDINSQLSKKVSEKDGFYIVRYELQPIASGASIDIPIKFKTDNGNTPDGFAISVIGNLFDKDNKPIVEPAKDTYKIETKKPKVSKYIKNDSSTWSAYDNLTITGGLEDKDKLGYLSNNLDDLNKVSFSYDLFVNNNATDFGNRRYEKIIFEDKIPEGAVFNQTDNPNWSFDETTRIAKYEFKPSSSILLHQRRLTSVVELHLKFPGAKIKDKLTNSVKATLTADNKASTEEDAIVNDDIDFYLNKKEIFAEPTSFTGYKSINKTVFDDEESKKGVSQWSAYVTNTASSVDHPNLNLENVSIIDEKLDENLKYTGLNISRMSTSVFVGTVDIIATLENGDKITVAENVDFTDNRVFELSEDVVSFEVLFTKDSYLKPNQTFRIYPQTEFKDPSKKILKENETYKYLRNYARFSGEYSNGKKYSTTANNYINLRLVDKRLGVVKSNLNKKESYFVHDTIEYSLNATYSSLPKNQIIDDAILIDLLPKGMEYVTNSSQIILYNNIETDLIKGDYEPEVIVNYHATGQTALKWHLKDFKVTTGIATTNSYIFKIDYKTKVTNLVEKGLNTNVAYLSWNNNEDINANTSTQTKDIYDINKNGSVDDYISSSNANINYVPPRELLLKKEVYGSLDDCYIVPPGQGLSEIGEDAKYKLTIFNNSITDLEEMYVLDLFPALNDQTASFDTKEQPAKRIDRNSSFKLDLKKAIDVPEKFNVFYTTSNPYDKTDKFTTDNIWQESLDDYSKATAIKLELKDGTKIKSGESIDFDIEFNVPFDKNLSETDIAVNSFGTAVTKSLNYTESNMSTLGLIKYSVQGYVFDDFNTNGNFEEGIDHPFKQHRVELVDKDNNVVLDPTGKPYQAMTDMNGFYKMEVYNNGEYKVRVVTPKDYKVANYKDGYLGTHIVDDAIGLTDEFILDRFNPNENRNAGYYQDSVSLEIKKIVSNGNPQLPSSLSLDEVKDDSSVAPIFEQKFDFTITINDELYNGYVNVNDKKVMVENGNIKLSHNDVVLLNDLDKNASYKIEENEVENYTVMPESRIHEGNLDSSITNLEFYNRYVIPKMDYTVKKLWVGGPENKPNIDVQLYQNGEEYGEPVAISSEDEWNYNWSSLDKTDENGAEYTYTVDELDVPLNYKKSIDDNVITNTFVPKDPKKPIVPNETDKPENNKKNPEKKTDVHKNKLPKTGQNINTLIYVLLSFTTILVFVRKFNLSKINK